ncbi:tRNA glutamyl-Q(34) synthetase GluQRS [Halotalea alkalilenta]|uniref:Glutamyl-Q tRNA(Asp) synthetase n=1 Tax=Halotalea alkalilenta TaxID=376489 RepID=A0A172Y9Z5_9GAMM|nr:tRNA glutamyl-Q(34) synthetase GluQRS [Halotalea alkalilenta]ANF56061.1 tRNA glutamyl-Q synthetase [Halotalea alkalilenta]
MSGAASYRGRFAPTPSGPLHFGSLIAALASWLDAHAVGGEWLLRIEDIDPPRCPRGASEDILRQLEAFGLHWDGDVRHQSRRSEAYQHALEKLATLGLAYPCGCSRKDWQGFDHYPGWCREGSLHPDRPQAWRLRTDSTHQPVKVSWQDRRLGRQEWTPAALGDVVLRRRDGFWAYQLAVTVDDGDQGITDVVRGSDLLDNTPWQLLLQRNLDLPTPSYLHLPLARAANGQKLSKQNLAPALPRSEEAARTLLHAALRALGQHPPVESLDAPVQEQLCWAKSHWRSTAIGQGDIVFRPALESR